MQEDNKRIAKNTIINYSNLFLSMFIGLFSSRFVLQALGASDYGLYNVVGGVIALFTFISGSLGATTVRFINFEIGKKNGNPNKVFNMCLFLHILLAVIIFIVAEIVGVWYIHNYLKIEPGKEIDAMFVFQISIITSCLSITNTPYSSLFNAFEKFAFSAIVGIGLRILQFLGIIVLLFYKGDALIFYAILMALTTVLSFSIYHFVSIKNWPEITHLSFINDRKGYKTLLSFSGYTILVSITDLVRNQGTNLLVNYFFNTVVNAAYGIAMSIINYVTALMSNFDGAVAPQLTKSVSSGDESRKHTLVFYSCRICLLVILLEIFPILSELDFILKLWLKNVPLYTSDFTRLILLWVLVCTASAGIGQYITSTGKIKWFRIIFSVCYLMCLPIGYFLFSEGFPPYSIILLFIISEFLYLICELYLLKRLFNFDVISFVRFAYIRPLIIILLMTVYLSLYFHFSRLTILEHFMGFILTLIVTGLFVWLIGLDAHDREKVTYILTKRKRSN